MKIIRNGMIATDAEVFNADILIDGEKIIAVGKDLRCEGAEVIDATGKYVLPGAVDVHTHMDLDVGFARAIDDFYTGTVAAACGGTTTIVDHMAFGPKDCSLWHQVNEYHRLADGNAVVDYGFHGVFQHVKENTLEEMREIKEKEGITSFKVYMTYDYRLEDDDMFKVLRAAKDAGIVITVHCENHWIIQQLRKEFTEAGCGAAKFHPLSRPARCEAEAVNRMIHIAAMAGDAPLYIVHLSSAEGLHEVIKARAEKRPNLGVETCIQYLTLTDDKYEDPQEGLKAIMSPPLRKDQDREELWWALKNGGFIDTVATDHCPFHFKAGKAEKQYGKDNFTKCPNGAPGVQERLMLLFSEGFMKGRLSLPQVVKYASSEPCRMFGMYPQKGSLEPGTDADIVIIDPEGITKIDKDYIRGASDYSCYEGMELKGCIEKVLLRGREIVNGGEFLGARGDGRYLKRGESVLCGNREPEGIKVEALEDAAPSAPAEETPAAPAVEAQAPPAEEAPAAPEVPPAEEPQIVFTPQTFTDTSGLKLAAALLPEGSKLSGNLINGMQSNHVPFRTRVRATDSTGRIYLFAESPERFIDYRTAFLKATAKLDPTQVPGAARAFIEPEEYIRQYAERITGTRVTATDRTTLPSYFGKNLKRYHDYMLRDYQSLFDIDAQLGTYVGLANSTCEAILYRFTCNIKGTDCVVLAGADYMGVEYYNKATAMGTQAFDGVKNLFGKAVESVSSAQKGEGFGVDINGEKRDLGWFMKGGLVGQMLRDRDGTAQGQPQQAPAPAPASKDEKTVPEVIPFGHAREYGKPTEVIEWGSNGLYAVVAPVDKEREAAQIFVQFVGTYHMDPELAERYSALRQQRRQNNLQETIRLHNMAQQSQMQLRQQQQKLAQQLAQNSREISAGIMDSWEKRSAAQSRMSRNYSEAIRGVDSYSTPSGSVIEASVAADHVYQNRYGDVIEVHGPDIDQSLANDLDWIKLSRNE